VKTKLPGLDELRQRLEGVRPIEIRSKWVSMTPFARLCENDPPDWLYTSGEENRYNPKGVLCVYFAADERTAKAEMLTRADENGGVEQPMVTYSAAVNLRKALDLLSAENLRKLGISQRHLFEEWEAKESCVTQILGQIVSEGHRFSSIRFPSAAAKEKGFRGVNLVIFRAAIHRPESLRVLGESNKTLQRWPC
jgi:hypothetical protein